MSRQTAFARLLRLEVVHVGRRDYRKREPKKGKKGAKKPAGTTELQPQASVDVVKKGRKEKEAERE
ncbi:MAG: hypothetical protein ACOC58_00650 [Chloroflexota bacterium]